jgi:hypothetical protein
VICFLAESQKLSTLFNSFSLLALSKINIPLIGGIAESTKGFTKRRTREKEGKRDLRESYATNPALVPLCEI